MNHYVYETHLHTYPVSKCAKASVRDNLTFYKRMGYAGVFITNHFLDGNINCDRSLPYEERISFILQTMRKPWKLARRSAFPYFSE